MADETSTASTDSAEKAFAAASEAVGSEKFTPVDADEPKAEKVEPKAEKVDAVAFPPKAERVVAKAPEAVPAKPVAAKVVAKAPVKAKVAAKPAVVAKAKAEKPVAAKPALAAPKAVAVKAPAKPAKPAAVSKSLPVISQIKDKTMSKTTEYAEDIKAKVTEAQNKAKVAFEKGKAVLTEAGEFTKGNVEAVVESTKILAAGVQDFGKVLIENGKGAYETTSADVKSLAAVKSPTEFVKLQGNITRRNLDSFIATGSKNAETMIKLYSDAFAPISARFSLAVEKVKKAA